MAKTAMSLLQEQIEAIRREAYAAGYTAAMQAIRDFAARPPSAPVAGARRGRPPKAEAPAAEPVVVRRRGRAAAKAPAARRPRRGSNARLIAEVLQAMPDKTARPAEIRAALQRDKGVAMAFTSIRHALGQLAGRNEAEMVADGKTWRYLGS